MAGKGGGGRGGRRFRGREEAVEEDCAAPSKKPRRAGRDGGDMSHLTCYTCFGETKSVLFAFFNLFFFCSEVGHRSYTCPKKPKKEKK